MICIRTILHSVLANFIHMSACLLAVWPEIQDILSNFNYIFNIIIDIDLIYACHASNLIFFYTHVNAV